MKKVTLIAGVCVALVLVITVGIVYTNKKVESDIEALLNESGLSEFVLYEDISYSLISDTLEFDNLSVNLPRGNFIVDKARLSGMGDMSGIPENLALDLEGVGDNLGTPFQGLSDIRGIDEYSLLGYLDKGTRANAVIFGLKRSADYSIGYDYDGDDQINFYLKIDQPGQYEVSYEHEISGITEADIAYANSILRDFKTTARIVSLQDRDSEYSLRFLEKVFRKMSTLDYSEVRKWQRDFSDRVLYAGSTLYVEDAGYIDYSNKTMMENYIFPDENIKEEETSELEYFIEEDLPKWDIEDLNGRQKEKVMEVVESISDFMGGNKSLTFSVSPKNPIGFSNLAERIFELSSLMDLMDQGVVEIEVD